MHYLSIFKNLYSLRLLYKAILKGLIYKLYINFSVLFYKNNSICKLTCWDAGVFDRCCIETCTLLTCRCKWYVSHCTSKIVSAYSSWIGCTSNGISCPIYVNSIRVAFDSSKRPLYLKSILWKSGSWTSLTRILSMPAPHICVRQKTRFVFSKLLNEFINKWERTCYLLINFELSISRYY